MKIGILFFGLPRNTPLTLPSIQEHILDPLVQLGHELHLYSCLTWRTEINNVRSNEYVSLNEQNYDFFSRHPHTYLSPEQLIDTDLFQYLINFGDSWKDDGQSLRNLMMQLHTLQKGFDALAYNQCDFYVFVRPDLVILEPIPFKRFFKAAAKNTIMLPSWQWHQGMNDRFAIASEKAAEVYASRYQKMRSFCIESKRPLHSERLMAYVIQSHGLQLYTCATKMARVRSNGRVVEEIYSVGKRMGGLRKAFYAQLRQICYQQRIKGLAKWLLYLLSPRWLRELL